MKMRIWKNCALAVAMATSVACEKGNRTFSLSAENNKYAQTAVRTQRKVDILWVIDNSNSMATSQARLVAAFDSFIHRFEAQGYDFHMAVTVTDAYRGNFPSLINTGIGESADMFRNLRDFGAKPFDVARGGCPVVRVNSNVLTSTTPDFSESFVKLAAQSTCGGGDEKPFHSLTTVLDPSVTANAGFRRAEAFLAVIIVSDEDDFSAWNPLTSEMLPDTLYNSYSDSRLVPVSHYKDYFDQASVAGPGNYNVNAISILDDDCLVIANTGSTFDRIKGTRIKALAESTGGSTGSICDTDFSTSLTKISNAIVNLTTSFQLTREPVIESFRISVNGAAVTNDSLNGWTYDASTLTITFHGTSVPPEGADVSILYDPVKPK